MIGPPTYFQAGLGLVDRGDPVRRQIAGEVEIAGAVPFTALGGTLRDLDEADALDRRPGPPQ